MRLWFWYVLLFLTCVSNLWSAECQTPPTRHQVLVLMSYHVGQPLEDGFALGLKRAIDSSAMPVELRFEYMDEKRFSPPSLDTIIEQTLLRKYQDACLEAVVVVDNIALDFSLNHRTTLFHNLPIVFLGVNNYTDSLRLGQQAITGIAEDNDIPGTLQMIRKLQPDSRNLYLVTDLTETGARMRKAAEAILKPDQNWIIHWLDQTSYEELYDSLTYAQSLSACLVLTYSKDRTNKLLPEKVFFKNLGERSRIPIYVMLEHQLNKDIMGGALLSGGMHGSMAAHMLLQILNGTPADSIPIIRKSPKLDFVNYPALQKFKIPLSLVSSEYTVGNEPYSLWEHYHDLIIATLGVFLILLGSIAVLLRMRNQLRISREHYKDLVMHANTVILRLDAKGNIQFINEYGENLFGYMLAELRDRNVMGTIVPEQEYTGRDLRNMMTQLLSKPGAFLENENENMTKAGKRLWIHWHNRPIYDSKGQLECIFSVGSDITEKHNHDEELARFNSKVSHDLRSPLITINSFAAMLRTDLEEGDQLSVQKDLDYIQTSASRMGKQLDELLHLSRIGVAKYDPIRFSIQDVAEEAAKIVAGRLSPLNLVPQITAKAWITGDRNRFVELFQNLFDNAAKNADPGRTPRIEVTIEIRKFQPAIVVRDNGRGIEPVNLEKIFVIFEKLNSKADGIGMGLTLVRRIVQVHGGSIWAESDGVGTGAAFVMILNNMEVDS